MGGHPIVPSCFAINPPDCLNAQPPSKSPSDNERWSPQRPAGNTNASFLANHTDGGRKSTTRPGRTWSRVAAYAHERNTRVGYPPVVPDSERRRGSQYRSLRPKSASAISSYRQATFRAGFVLVVHCSLPFLPAVSLSASAWPTISSARASVAPLCIPK